MLRSYLASFALIMIACAAYAGQDIVVMEPVILPDIYSERLFYDAIRWSKSYELETGGCFNVVGVVGNKVLIADAVERVIWRRSGAVQLDCSQFDGIWHTHWRDESKKWAGCNVNRAKDLFLISRNSALGLIVCGARRDSLIPYDYSPEADSVYQDTLRKDPKLAFAERAAIIQARQFRCEDESLVSLKRPIINCRK